MFLTCILEIFKKSLNESGQQLNSPRPLLRSLSVRQRPRCSHNLARACHHTACNWVAWTPQQIQLSQGCLNIRTDHSPAHVFRVSLASRLMEAPSRLSSWLWSWKTNGPWCPSLGAWQLSPLLNILVSAYSSGPSLDTWLYLDLPRATLSTFVGFSDLYLQGLRVSSNHLLPSLRYLMCVCMCVMCMCTCIYV